MFELGRREKLSSNVCHPFESRRALAAASFLRPMRRAGLATLIGIALFAMQTGMAPRNAHAAGESQAACTLYVTPQGSARNRGTSSRAATTLLAAAKQAVAGDVVCIQPGKYALTSTFAPAHSGKPGAWIVFRREGEGEVRIVWAAGPHAPDRCMVHMYSPKFPNGPSYLEFDGLTLDGRNIAANGFFCQGSHHLRYVRNIVLNQGSAGIGSVRCDYQTADHNIVYHSGYNGGWSSGISYNSNQWFDNYPGLHNIVANNIVAGSYDSSHYHTDGNGIIMDLSSGTYVASSANTPPALIVNNVVYGNGGRCIENYVVTNVWVVNNTCYDNGLDLSLGGVGNMVSHSANAEYFINNIVVSWNREAPFMRLGAEDAKILYRRNLIYGAPNSGLAERSAQAFVVANPQFVNPPHFDPNRWGQYAKTPNPSLLGDGLEPRPDSPVLGAGIDPAKLPNLSPVLLRDMVPYLYADIDGRPRPKGGPFDLGAYQVSSVPTQK
jgi:Right handed beta helix region